MQSHLAEMAIQPAVASNQGQNHPQPNSYTEKKSYYTVACKSFRTNTTSTITFLYCNLLASNFQEIWILTMTICSQKIGKTDHI
jgi:hypothetical protein